VDYFSIQRPKWTPKLLHEVVYIANEHKHDLQVIQKKIIVWQFIIQCEEPIFLIIDALLFCPFPLAPFQGTQVTWNQKIHVKRTFSAINGLKQCTFFMKLSRSSRQNSLEMCNLIIVLFLRCNLIIVLFLSCILLLNCI
jgi:hypothetical protein